MVGWLMSSLIYFGVIYVFPTLLRNVLVNNPSKDLEYIFMAGLVALELGATVAVPFITNTPAWATNWDSPTASWPSSWSPCWPSSSARPA
jgi:hypothetical protein